MNSKPRDGLAVWPAAAEVRLPVEMIVQRTREVKIAGEESAREPPGPSSHRRHTRLVRSRCCWLSPVRVSAWLWFLPLAEIVTTR